MDAVGFGGDGAGAARCTAMGGEVPAEEGEPPEVEAGMAPAAAYLPATVTDKLAAIALDTDEMVWAFSSGESASKPVGAWVSAWAGVSSRIDGGDDGDDGGGLKSLITIVPF